MIIKKAYVLGTRVDKSLSPIIFNYWIKKYKINAKYSYKKIKEKDFKKEIGLILKEKNLCGLNITIPFKEKIINKLQKLDKPSKIIGASNCITIKKNKYYGSNTDWTGFTKALKDSKFEQKNKHQKNKIIILIGYGGAAKAILYSLSLMKRANKKNTIVFNRSKRKINIPFISQKKTISLNKLERYLDKACLIINTTPKNILNDLKIKKITKKIAVCDIVYKPRETSFLKHFINPTSKIYGIDMLINQARPCFYKWFGILPSKDKILTNKLLKKIIK